MAERQEVYLASLQRLGFREIGDSYPGIVLAARFELLRYGVEEPSFFFGRDYHTRESLTCAHDPHFGTVWVVRGWHDLSGYPYHFRNQTVSAKARRQQIIDLTPHHVPIPGF